MMNKSIINFTRSKDENIIDINNQINDLKEKLCLVNNDFQKAIPIVKEIDLLVKKRQDYYNTVYGGK